MYAAKEPDPCNRTQPRSDQQEAGNFAISQYYGNTAGIKAETIFESQNARSEAIAQCKLQKAVSQSPQVEQAAAVQRMADGFAASSVRKNDTGLPDQLKSGVEQLSGIALDDVKVHYRSDKPEQLQAHAYAQGTDIYIAPGQEQHLPHEAWHVVQQKQGRVAATKQLKGAVGLNDDAGLEAEADTMGAKALQLKTGTVPVQRVEMSAAGGVVQLVNKKIGDPVDGVTDRFAVVREIRTDNTLSWPTARNAVFSNHYGGSVRKAMDWALNSTEGTAGWTGREYFPQEFHNLANKAYSVFRKLTEPALNNDSNKTLIAIRTFRSSQNEDVAISTAADLRTILATVNDAREALVQADLIPDASDPVEKVEADPAEAHPNTLPTAKVTFGTGNTVYFKGRSARVEDAINGTLKSSAEPISRLGTQDEDNRVGTHVFVGQDDTHITQNVGPKVPQTNVTFERALTGWISAIRTALLGTLTGLSDLHSSNVIEGTDGKKHIIDGEFLLDLKSWPLYEQALKRKGSLPFDLEEIIPDWALEYVKLLQEEKKELFARQLVEEFNSYGLHKEETQEQILGPIRSLIAGGHTLLRISPFPTDQWLRNVTTFHNTPVDGRGTFVDRQWDILGQIFDEDYRIGVNNDDAAKEQLADDFNKGRVPLLHIEAASGDVYLDKQLVIGRTSGGHSISDYVELIKQVVSKGIETEEFQNEIVKIVRKK